MNILSILNVDVEKNAMRQILTCFFFCNNSRHSSSGVDNAASSIAESDLIHSLRFLIKKNISHLIFVTVIGAITNELL